MFTAARTWLGRQAWFLRIGDEFRVEKFAGDFRQSAISGSAGALVALAVSGLFASSDAYMFELRLSQSGIGFPSQLISDARSEEKLGISFGPKELEKIAICEYFREFDKTATDLLLRYLQRYQECLQPVYINATNILIRPKDRVEIYPDSTGASVYTCRCTKQTIDQHLRGSP